MTALIDAKTIFTLPIPFGETVSAWWVDLDAHFENFDPGLMQSNEISRADRMIVPCDARRFLASRHALRSVLAAYNACSPQEIRYRLSNSGKPVLLNAKIEFSLSRSQRYALIACSRHHPVGADIETLRPIPERDSLIESAFCGAEKQAIQSVSAAEKDMAFLKVWVRKEACLKATGLGVAIPMPQVIVGAGPNKREVCVEDKQHRWRVEVASSESPPSTVAALAMAQPE